MEKPSPESVIGSVAGDFVDKLAQGQTPDIREYTTRFPEFASEIVDVLTCLQSLTDQQRVSPGTVVGRYQLLEAIGEGGMGTVYRAQRVGTEEIVAVKRLHQRDTPRHQARFRREFEVLQRLDHPGFARVEELVEHQGELYLVMEYVAGTNLTGLVESQGPFEIETALQVIRQMAAALSRSHQQGVIHRDIKPSNVMQTPQGDIRVVDFGLAAIQQSVALLTESVSGEADASRSFLTQSSDVIGTCEFMAPEQMLASRDVDHRTDVYGLGCVLYFLLTGQVPFRKPSPLATLIAHREEPPPSVRDLRKSVPRWLDQLCRRMLAKSPKSRPQSMQAVITSIDGRHRSQRRAVIGVLSATCVILCIAVWSLRNSQPEVKLPVDAPNGAKATVVTQPTDFATVSPRSAWEGLKLTEPREDYVVSEQGTRFPVIHQLGDDRMMHWNYVSDVTYSHAGELLVSGGWDGVVNVWDAVTGERLSSQQEDTWVMDIDISFDDRYVAIGYHDGSILVWDWEKRTICDSYTWSNSAEDPVLAFHPSAPLLAIGDEFHQDIFIRNYEERENVYQITLDEAPELCGLEFNGQGDRLICIGRHVPPQLWDVASQRLLHTYETSADDLRCLGVHPHENRFVVGDGDGRIELFDFDGSHPLRSLRAHDAPVRRVTFDPVSQRILSSGEDQKILAYDEDLVSELSRVAEETRSNWGLASHPQGSYVASCGTDQEVIQWDVRGQNTRRLFANRRGKIWSLNFSPTGAEMLVGHADGTIRIWDLQGGQLSVELRDSSREITAVVFHPQDRQFITTAGRDGEVHQWNLEDQTHQLLHDHPGSAFTVAYSASGEWLASGGWDRRVQLTNLQTGEHVLLSGHTQMVNDLTFSADDQYLVSVDGDRLQPGNAATVRVWDLSAHGALVNTIDCRAALMAIDAIPHSSNVLLGGYENASLAQFTIPDQFQMMEQDQFITWDIAVDGGGRLAAVGDGQGCVQLWDVQTRQLIERLRLGPQMGEIHTVSFSPDGDKLAFAQGNGRVSIIQVSVLNDASTGE